MRSIDEPITTHARIVTIRFRPETLDLALQRFRDVSTPRVRAQPGSLGILGAANRENGRTYAISLWHTREHLERSNAIPAVVEALSGYADWMAGQFTVESFEVVSGTLPRPGSDDLEHARLTSLVAEPHMIESIVTTMRQRLSRVVADYPECIGTLLLGQIIGYRIIAFELWSANEALVRSDEDALLADRRVVRDGSVAAPTIHDLLDVFDRC